MDYKNLREMTSGGEKKMKIKAKSSFQTHNGARKDPQVLQQEFVTEEMNRCAITTLLQVKDKKEKGREGKRKEAIFFLSFQTKKEGKERHSHPGRKQANFFLHRLCGGGGVEKKMRKGRAENKARSQEKWTKSTFGGGNTFKFQ